MSILDQVVNIVPDKKAKATSLLTASHHSWKEDLLGGLTRTYEPNNAEGETLPPEKKIVRLRVKEEIKKIVPEIQEFFDLVGAQETGNTMAKADLVVDGQVMIKDVPVTVLMFLKKQLVDLRTFVSNLPTLSTDKEWEFSPEANCYVTQPTQQVRTQKEPHTQVLFEPTQYQPGQAQILQIDRIVGKWTSKHFSGAIPESEKVEASNRIDKLLTAVKEAHTLANHCNAPSTPIGKPIMEFIFGKLLT